MVETKTVELATSNVPEWVRMRLNSQKMKAIQLTFSDSGTSTDADEAITLHGVGLEMGLRGGTFKVNTNKEVT